MGYVNYRPLRHPITRSPPGNPSNPELIQIPAGQLYLVRPDSIKGSRECMCVSANDEEQRKVTRERKLTRSFKDAVATIRRTGTEFQYQLVVTRAYEEGEEQLLEEDAESECNTAVRQKALTTAADDERVFLIDQALGFRFGSLDGAATFAWSDISGDEGDLWEFIANTVRALHWACERC